MSTVVNGVLKIELPTPHAGQLKVFNSKAQYRVIMCGRQWGKSSLCIILSLQSILNGQRVAYITPNFSLGEKFFREISKWIPESIIKTANKSSLYLELTTGGTLQFYSSEARSLRGNTWDRLIFDEAAHIPDLKYIFEETIEPTLATTDGDVIFVSTPNGYNFFHSCYLKGKHFQDGYESFNYPSSASPYVKQTFLDKKKKSLPEDVWRQEYLAEPLASSGNPFGIDHIKKNTVTTLSTKPTVAIGIDVAKYKDYTVMIGLDEDGVMTMFDRYRGEWSLTKDKIKALPADVSKVMDSTGVGDVIFEELLQTVSNLQGFKFTSGSKPQLMKELIVDVQAGSLKYNEATAEEMKSFEYSLTATGHPKYEAQSGYHDDCIIALGLANRLKKQFGYMSNWKLYTI